MFEIKGKYTTAKVMIDDVEETCVSQIVSFVNHEAFTNPIAIMPDTHAGKGAVIGFSMKMTDKVIPNVIGVDISCGMRSINVGGSLPLSLEEIDHKIRQRVPFGYNTQEKPLLNLEREFDWHSLNFLAERFRMAYEHEMNQTVAPHVYNFGWFREKCKTIGIDLGRALKSIGSLGGGNHFIEIGMDKNEDNWVTIHCGSRNFGKCVCDYWQGLAAKKFSKDTKEDRKVAIADLKATYTGKELYEKIKAYKSREMPKKPYPDEQLWLEGEDAHGYLYDMIFCQAYAALNREHIARIIMDILKTDPTESFETVHNFIDFDDFIIRKGAIRAYAGERCVIPFNMRDGILLCEGKSNQEWNCSAPHGAGRVMSRSKAKKEINVDAFKIQMEGIYSTSVGAGTLDEAPDAYKDSAIIEEAIEPTAVIIDRIRPIHNMKDQGSGRPLKGK